MKDILLMFKCFLKKLEYYHSQDIDDMENMDIWIDVICDGFDAMGSEFENIEEKVIDYLHTNLDNLDTDEKLELLQDESWTYDPWEAIYEMKETYGLDFIHSGRQLKEASIHFYLEKEIKDNLNEEGGWLQEFNDDLGKRFDVLKKAWNEKQIIKRNKLIEKLPIHCVSHLVINYL